MAAMEGAFRIKRAGKWITSVAVAIFVAGIVAIITMSSEAYMNDVRRPIIHIVIFLGLFPALFGGILWATGWIVEGFAQRTSSPIEKL